jgi:hypothetical protein
MKMLSDESRNRAIAKVRILALGLACFLAASGTLAAITPAHDCGAANVLACGCCQSSDAKNAHSVGESLCCDGPDPVRPAPAATELGNQQRFEDPLFDQILSGAAGARACNVALGWIEPKRSRASAPYSYILFCSFLI